jgi:hypothetical protein
LCTQLRNHPKSKPSTAAAAPEPLNINSLFDPDSNQHMWMEQDLNEAASAPRYMYDSQIREGIAAMLVLDRAEEEEHRLQAEAQTMGKWLGLQLKRLHWAIEACQGSVDSLLGCILS